MQRSSNIILERYLDCSVPQELAEQILHKLPPRAHELQGTEESHASSLTPWEEDASTCLHKSLRKQTGKKSELKKRIRTARRVERKRKQELVVTWTALQHDISSSAKTSFEQWLQNTLLLSWFCLPQTPKQSSYLYSSFTKIKLSAFAAIASQ